MSTESLKPTMLWNNFKAICSIPHPSKHEEKLVAYLKKWAQERNIDVKQDEIGNLIFSKPATPGMENRKGVILQGHIDMVPQKNSDKVHDFTKDPIEMIVRPDGWVSANGTTLGADNGIGCAAALSVLESDDIQHGPLEVLITIDEETGMTGAFGLKPGLFKGDILMNLDSETEGELYVGCAGGLDANITLKYSEMPTPAHMQGVKISLTGLNGGHSGMDIHMGRGNANKIIIRLLKQCITKCDMQIATINGGSLRNAIPREAFVEAAVPEAKYDAFIELFNHFRTVIMNEFSAVEHAICLEVQKTAAPKNVITKADQLRIVNMVYAMPNGVMRMSDSMEGLVETSTNLAILKAENGVMEMKCLLRSSVDSAKEAVGEKMVAIAEMAGAEITLTGAYPGWKPNMDSPILKTMLGVYQKLFNKPAEIKAIHAGLECGLLGGMYPNWDMISFGPTISHPHSPDEKVNVESVDKFWRFLIETLKNVPTK